jgi:hypothetical protein
MGLIHEVRRLGDLGCHDTHTTFHNNPFQYSSTIGITMSDDMVYTQIFLKIGTVFK